MAATDFEIPYPGEGALPITMEGFMHRCPSTVSDCYSNDDEFMEHDSDRRVFGTSEFGGGPFHGDSQKHELVQSHSEGFVEDEEPNSDKANITHSSMETSQIVETDITSLNPMERAHFQPVLIDRDSSSEGHGISSLKEHLVPKYLRRNPDDHMCNDDTSAILYRQESQQSGIEQLQPLENTVSDSMFEFLKNNRPQLAKVEDRNAKSVSSDFLTNLNRKQHKCKDPVRVDDQDLLDHPKVLKIPKVTQTRSCSFIMKTVSNWSSQGPSYEEQATQTSPGLPGKEVCIGTNQERKVEEVECQAFMRDDDDMGEYIRPSEPYRSSVSMEVNEGVPDVDVGTAMEVLREHVFNLVHIASPASCQGLSSLFDRGGGLLDHIPFGPESMSLYTQIKQLYTLLESKVNLRLDYRGQPRHRRHFSSDCKAPKTAIIGSGDFTNDQQHLEGSLYKLKKTTFSMGTACAPSSDYEHFPCRTFELNPYDDLVRSWQSSSDRRIKSVGNKMKCKIAISGPIRIFDSTNSCWNMRKKTAFRCSIRGASKETVDKCLKCLQETFPQSCLNEKQVSGRGRPDHNNNT